MGGRDTRIVPAIAAVALFVAASAIVAPLATYTLTLAVFGLPHILGELRYVDRRFGRSISAPQLTRMLVLLGLIVSARTATVFHALPTHLGIVLELSGVVLLALSVAAGPLAQRALAVGVASCIALATLASPYDTAVASSILHNMTPLGFLWQIVPREKRLTSLCAASLGFIGIPLLVASGIPREALAAWGWLSNADPIGAGPLASHFFVYVPKTLLGAPHAIDFFSASVAAQGAHYFAVIVALPVLLQRLEPRARGIVGWPRGTGFAALLAGAAALSLSVFARGFADARLLYGIAASFHAWLEIPVLVLALTSLSQAKYATSPAAQDARLATSETSIAR